MVDSIASAASGGSGASKSQQSEKKLNEDMDYFMNLLVTQLKNQDPLDPMDPNEFTNQLVQFSAVEQQIQGNANLEELIALQKSGQFSTVVNYIGMLAEASGDQMALKDGVAKVSYTLGEDAAKTVINIKNADGDSVYLSTSGETGAGRHEFTWDGKNTQGFPERDGIYTVTVSSLDADGAPIDVAQTVAGTVTGVSMDGGDVTLHLGSLEVGMSDLLSIQQSPTNTVN